jgi:hypothetical protein
VLKQVDQHLQPLGISQQLLLRVLVRRKPLQHVFDNIGCLMFLYACAEQVCSCGVRRHDVSF